MTDISSPHPGRTLERVAKKRGINQMDLANMLGVSRVGVNQLFRGKRAVSPLMALRLAALFPEKKAKFWLEQQNIVDLQKAYEANKDELDQIQGLGSKK